MRQVLVIHYDEIALKGGAREWFEQQLSRNIRHAIGGKRAGAVKRLYGRLLLIPAEGVPATGLAERIRLLPGVASAMPAFEVPDDFDRILAAVEAVLPRDGVRTFGVRARRGDKSYPRSSQEIGRDAGAFVVGLRGWEVDLGKPDLWIRIEVSNGKALVGAERFLGPGGLPVGASGKGIALLSGGIDSPVAAWMMMTRGLRLTLLHFHSAPFTSGASQDKVRELGRVLAQAQPGIDLVMIPFAEPIQQAIVESAESRYRVLLYRRFMLRIAERAARESGAGCLVTGEALGQVASQTLENLTAVSAAGALPVLRPLIGMGKGRIVELARALGSYDISIRPHDDCCTYLMPDRPATRSTAEELAAAESGLEVADLVERTWQARSVERFDLPPWAVSAPPAS